MADRSYSVTFYSKGKPTGEFNVTAPSSVEAVAKVSHDHAKIMEEADDFTVIEVQPESSLR